jgi:ADP-ribosyl-[dinitrogen reductase] hydrolase
MSLCLADSILAKNFEFDPIDLRYRFLLWLDFGLNNGGRPYSIGLGGNISIAMSEFNKEQVPYCEEGDRFNNGNGSLMRLAPSAIGYVDDLELGMEVSAKQSRTTHNGDEARECSRLLARIIIKLISRDATQDPKAVLVEACESFAPTGK